MIACHRPAATTSIYTLDETSGYFVHTFLANVIVDLSGLVEVLVLHSEREDQLSNISEMA